MFFSARATSLPRACFMSADAGEAQAAVRLGETFDPIFLDHAHLRGVRANVETALSWYRRARDLGAAEAEILLNSLQAK
jgi:hypothetical protein